MTKTVVLVVRDEEFYINMCLQSILPFIDNLYILDTGSIDKTIEIITEFSIKYPNKIILEQKDFGGNRRFAVNYRECEARNYALDRAKNYFNPDWIICVDADEVYNEYFWSLWGTAITSNNSSVGHATDCPTTPTTISRHPKSMVDWGSYKLHDPHCRIWNTHTYNVHWIHPKDRHVILSHDGINDLTCDVIISDVVHFHFHHTFGPKSIYSWLNRGLLTQPGNSDGSLTEDIYSQKIYECNYPYLFNKKGQFLPPHDILESNASVSILLNDSNKLPNYVVEKWNTWWSLEYVNNIFNKFKIKESAFEEFKM